MTMDQRLDQLEKRNKRLTIALTMTVVAMAAVVTMAATGDKDGHFDAVVARSIAVVDDSGAIVITLAPGDEEMNEDKNSGHIKTYDASSDTAKMLVSLGQYGYSGLVEVYHSNYYSGYDTQTAVSLGSDGLLGGEVMTWHIN